MIYKQYPLHADKISSACSRYSMERRTQPLSLPESAEPDSNADNL